MPPVSEIDSRVIASLLLSLLAVVISVGLALMYLVIRWRHRHSPVTPPAPWLLRRWQAGSQPWHAHNPLAARPQTWIAIRTTDLPAVQNAFALANPRPCAWTDGLGTDPTGRLYVSPPVAGWVLVVGAQLPEPAEDIDACFRFLVALSRRLGHVQYFHASRVLQHHGWARLESGRVLRAYAWAGHTVWNQGAPTAAERELGLRDYGYGEAECDSALGVPDAAITNVERIPRLAARWSLDPASVDARFWASHRGISGETSVSRML